MYRSLYIGKLVRIYAFTLLRLCVSALVRQPMFVYLPAWSGKGIDAVIAEYIMPCYLVHKRMQALTHTSLYIFPSKENPYPSA